ncbi:SDR family NAD(P)-dependent oxidoreductase [Legionella wadsworthii]|nr:SDR family NAD(P)-dependent oxidoreductase [Legionella wadsworthii]
MMQRTWIVFGATSIIAEKFAHCVAQAGHHLLLVGRQQVPLEIIANDIKIRYKILCDILVLDLVDQMNDLVSIINSQDKEIDLFLAHSDFTENDHLNAETINHLIQLNIQTNALLIHTYINRKQQEYNLLYLSSVAACRGRAKNSLYGASKATIEIYLQGLQQAAPANLNITIARLGFIDTKQTYGLPGIFYAAPPELCAKACWSALQRRKKMFYYPYFWELIMGVITRLPFFVYQKMSNH